MIKHAWATRLAALAGTAALAVLLLLTPGPSGVVRAADPPQPAATDAQSSGEQTLSRKERKQQAKEARIAEYLRKREERRARRDLEREAKLAQQAAEPGSQPTLAGAAADAKNAKKKGQGAPAAADRLPRNLARVQQSLRINPIAEDPTVQAYMTLIDEGRASPHQLAAFGNFLGQNGMTREAIEYYGVALRMEKRDPLLWMNVGTLHRKLGEGSVAASAYARALSLDNNNAFAHYNLGAVLDEMGNDEEAIEEYKLALTLDPTLGDPAYNPQATNNDRLLAVKLLLYQEQAGSLGLPLVPVPGGELDTDEAAASSPRQP